jgi:hypothetical protein
MPERAYDIANHTLIIRPQAPSPAATKNAMAAEVEVGVVAAKIELSARRARCAAGCAARAGACCKGGEA